jgi:hypothetical protein
VDLALRVPAWVAIGVVAGCNYQLGEATPGSDTGRVRFSYESGDCFFGCSMGPMMVGTTENVSAQLSSVAAGATVTVDDPATLSMANVLTGCCGAGSCGGTQSNGACDSSQQQSISFELTAKRTGSTRVRIVQGGAEIDGITLSVRDPARIAPTCGPGSSVSLAVGASCVIDWTVNDAAGAKLQASRGISLSVPDPGVAGIVVWGAIGPSDPNAGIGLLASDELKGVAQGRTRLVASVGGVSGEIPVNVTAK